MSCFKIIFFQILTVNSISIGQNMTVFGYFEISLLIYDNFFSKNVIIMSDIFSGIGVQILVTLMILGDELICKFDDFK